MKRVSLQLGFSLLEVILAVSLLALFVVGFAGAWIYGEEATALSGNRIRALALAEEGLEAARNIRDSGYTNLIDGTHGLSTTSNQWNFAGSSNSVGQFTRSVVVASIDARRKSVTSTVTWQQNQQRTGEVSLTTRLTEWARVILTWALPLRTTVVNQTGAQDSLRVDIQGNFAYVIRDNATQDFLIYDISNPLTPTQVGQLSLAGTPFGLFVLGSYAYVASTDNAQELQIINISTPSAPVLVGSYNDAGTDDALDVFVLGTRAYMTFDSGNEFVVVNVANPASPTVLGTLNSSGLPLQLHVVGSYAYLTNDSNTQEVQVINVTNPAAPVLAGSLNLAGNADALSITSFGSTLLVGRAGTSGLAVVSISSPATPTLVGSVASSDDINYIVVNGDATLAFAATSHAAQEFKVFNIATLATPTLFGFFNNTGTSDGDLYGVAYHAGQDRAYAVGDADAAEFMIYAPQ